MINSACRSGHTERLELKISGEKQEPKEKAPNMGEEIKSINLKRDKILPDEFCVE